jgi:uncharacterized membrane protein YoaK (UPF0700 family)
LLELGLLVAAWIAGIHYDSDLLRLADIDGSANTLVACLLGASMGFQNVAAKEAVANCPPTTVMTSTLINVAQNLSNTVEYGLASRALFRLAPPGAAGAAPEHRAAMAAKFSDSRDKFVTTAKPLLSFIVGCLVGASSVHRITWHCLAIPVAVVLLVAVDTAMQARPDLAPPRPAVRIDGQNSAAGGSCTAARSGEEGAEVLEPSLPEVG